MASEESANILCQFLHNCAAEFIPTHVKDKCPLIWWLYMIFVLCFRHKSALTLTKLIGVDPSLDLDLGVCHADELFPMFHQKDLEAMKTPADREMGQKMLKLW